MARNHMYPQWEGLREEREMSCLVAWVSLQCRGPLHLYRIGLCHATIGPLQLYSLYSAVEALQLYSLYTRQPSTTPLRAGHTGGGRQPHLMPGPSQP
eukprot:1095771-Prymnesium_polylepis.1